MQAGSPADPVRRGGGFFPMDRREVLLWCLFAGTFFLLSLGLIRLLLGPWALTASGMLTLGAVALLFALKASFVQRPRREGPGMMRRSDRLSLLGTLTAGLAHEIRNPLVSIKTYFQLLPERYDDQDFRDRFQKVASKEVDRISRLVEELLEFARPSDPKFRSVNVHALLDEVLTLVDAGARKRKIELVRDYGAVLPEEFVCDPEQIKQVLLNIARNAFDAVNGDGRVIFRTRSSRPADEKGVFIIEIEDNGVGITEEQQRRLFTPFFTTKSSGTGLGLAISRRIVEDHLGTLTLESRPKVGTKCRLQLPRNPQLHERRRERVMMVTPDQKDRIH
ncbi:MAG: hypothetical protein GXP58_09120 [Deltaproteobacteria bacterium]|nr:hypothetical protein [Deltaproteobacteria bacterium]